MTGFHIVRWSLPPVGSWVAVCSWLWSIAIACSGTTSGSEGRGGGESDIESESDVDSIAMDGFSIQEPELPWNSVLDSRHSKPHLDVVIDEPNPSESGDLSCDSKPDASDGRDVARECADRGDNCDQFSENDLAEKPDSPIDSGGGRKCGDGELQSSEECDDGLANGTVTSCCSATCTLRVPGQACSVNQNCRLGKCDGFGLCTDAGAEGDGAPCDNAAGDTCCFGACVMGNPNKGSCGGDCYVHHQEGSKIAILDSDIYSNNTSGKFIATRWQNVALAMGHSPKIVPLEYLEFDLLMDDPDVLIITTPFLQFHPELWLTDLARSNVEAFLISGRGVYVQTEFNPKWFVNQWYGEMVSSFGHEFVLWSQVAEFDGVVPGCWAAYPEVIEGGVVPGFFWGCKGFGSPPGMHVILQRCQTQTCAAVGFAYCTTETPSGLLVTVTDADWLKSGKSEGSFDESHLRYIINIIARLVRANDCHDWPIAQP